MAEKPILFSTPMVQAILDERKNMTRRVIKPQPPHWEWNIHKFEKANLQLPDGKWVNCPYGQPGDRLWVREMWRIGAWDGNNGRIAVDYKADGYIRREWLDVEDPERFERYWIQSTHDAEKAGLEFDSDGQYHWEPGKAPTRWRPSIFMPKEAARIWLDVTDVRVERLQEIATDDAKAEGVLQPGVIPSNTLIRNTEGSIPRTNFKILWDSLNASRGFSWEQNPWVWVISFEREG